MFRFLRNIVLLALLAIVLEEAYFRVLYQCDWSEYKGEYALVTGSSMGIGKSFAEELASKGINVILHGRRGEVLEGIKKEIKQKHPSIDVRYIVQDVVKNPKWDEVEKSIEGLKISVLVNNVGLVILFAECLPCYLF